MNTLGFGMALDYECENYAANTATIKSKFMTTLRIVQSILLVSLVCMHLFVFAGTSVGPLPGVLKSFEATNAASGVELNWSFSEEKELSHFIIEKSVDGKQFNDVAIIFSNTALAGNEYTYGEVVSDDVSKSCYYRLRLVSSDGSFKYSPIRKVVLPTAVASATESGKRSLVINNSASPSEKLVLHIQK